MVYVRSAWYVAAWTQEIAAERPAAVRVLDEPIVLWRNAAGELAAFEDRCIHRLAPLSMGRCEGERLRCMYHGLLYDRTGRVVEIPGQVKLSSGLQVRSYPVIERHGWIWIWMGTGEADQGLIPQLLDRSQPGCIFGQGHIDYAAEARLVTDNLLDLSHTTFLHAETFRASETWAREQPKITEHERCIRTERWLRDESGGGVAGNESADSYFRQDFHVPGVVLMTVESYPVGTADLLHGHPPGAALPSKTFAFTSQAVTPLTERTARYFYTFGTRPRADETQYDLTITEQAFAEDKTMIEAQQRNIDSAPGRRFIATIGDRGAVLYNRLVEKLVREESARLDVGTVSQSSRQDREIQ